MTLSFDTDLPEGLSLFTVNHAGEVDVSTWSRIDPNAVTVTSIDGDAATDLDGVSDGFVYLLIGVGTTRGDDGNVGGSGDVTEGGAGNLADDAGVEARGGGGGGGGGCSVGGIRQRDPLLAVPGLCAFAWTTVRRRVGHVAFGGPLRALPRQRLSRSDVDAGRDVYTRRW